MFKIIVEKETKKIISFGFGDIPHDEQLHDKVELENAISSLILNVSNEDKQYYYVDNKVVESI